MCGYELKIGSVTFAIYTKGGVRAAETTYDNKYIVATST